MCHRTLFLLVCALINNVIVHTDGTYCLPNAVPPSERRLLTIEGVQTPLQLWQLDWDSAALVTEVFKILAQEKLGFETVVGASARSSSSRSVPRALTGCSLPKIYTAPCTFNSTFSYYHLGFEAWHSIFIDTLTDMETLHPRRAAELLGEVGYSGYEGMFLTNRVQNHALNTAGVALDHYRSYNISWHTPWSFFTPHASINSSELLPCSDVTTFNDAALIQNYLHWTGDSAGVSNGVARCWEGHWFFSPACRASPSTCIPVLLDSVWYFNKLAQMMQQAFWNSMPLAFAVPTTRSEWTNVSVTHDVLFYWWIPDSIFVAEKPHIISFTHHDPAAYAKGLFASAFGSDKLWKLSARGLGDVAREVYIMGKNLQISLNTIQAMLFARANTGKSIHEVACDWIIQNNDTWTEWLPDPRVCPSGQGLVTPTNAYTIALENATKCASCSPGRVSESYPGGFATRVCNPCTVGKFSIAYGAATCDLCLQGKHTALTMQTKCERCVEGKYQSSFGSTACVDCNATFITKFQGAYESTDCVCPFGSSFVERTGQCEKCPPEGILCPGGFVMGHSGTDASPVLEPGYMALPEDPLSVYFCIDSEVQCECFRSPFPLVAENHSYCADASKEVPKTMCGAGMTLSKQCAACADGYRYQKGGGCKACPSDGLFYSVFSITVGTIAQCGTLLYLYVRFNIPQPSGYVVLGCVISFGQFVAATGRLPLLWPSGMNFMPALEWAFTPSGMFSLFNFFPECVVGNSFIKRLVYTAATPMVLLSMFFPLHLMFRLFGAHLQRHFVLNTIGLIFGNCFVAISGMTLTMFTYDRMPNGELMTREFPELEIGSTEWLHAMPVSVFACLMYCVTFLVYVANAAITAPRRAADNAIFCKQYLFMIGIMRPECWWWLLVTLLFGFSVNAIQTLSSSVHFKLYASIFVGMAFVATEIYTLPFKFMICNAVDIILKSGVFIIWILCLPLVGDHDDKQKDAVSNACGYTILFILTFVLFVAGGAFLHWLIGLLAPPGLRRGARLRKAMQSRHIVAAVDLLKEKELLHRLSRLGDEDLNKLSRCTSMIASALLELQPSESLAYQRVMPGVPFQVWDPKLTEIRIMQSTLSGAHERALLKNLGLRRQIVHLGRLMSDYMLEHDNANLFETDAFKGCSSTSFRGGGAFDCLMALGEHTIKRFFNMVLSYNATPLNKEAALLGLHNHLLDESGFVSAVKDLLGSEAEELDIRRIFAAMDLDKDGSVNMEDFVTTMMSESQERIEIAHLKRASNAFDSSDSNITALRSLDSAAQKIIPKRLSELKTCTDGLPSGGSVDNIEESEGKSSPISPSSPECRSRLTAVDVPGCLVHSEDPSIEHAATTPHTVATSQDPSPTDQAMYPIHPNGLKSIGLMPIHTGHQHALFSPSLASSVEAVTSTSLLGAPEVGIQEEELPHRVVQIVSSPPSTLSGSREDNEEVEGPSHQGPQIDKPLNILSGSRSDENTGTDEEWV